METIGGLSIKKILEDHWETFKKKYPGRIRKEVIENVEKLLSCRTAALGFYLYECPTCRRVFTIYNTCKSRLCSSCGKVLTDNWVHKLSTVFPACSYRHIFLTMPQQLWPIFLQNRFLFNDLIHCGVDPLLEDCKQKRGYIPAMLVGIHTFGAKLNFNVHLHILISTGGISLDHTKWIDDAFKPYKWLGSQWRERVIALLRTAHPHLVFSPSMAYLYHPAAFNNLLDSLYQRAWIIQLKEEMPTYKEAAAYIARYTKRPPMAQMRILAYDGQTVTFSYEDKTDGKLKKMPLSALQFIARLVRHIPPKYFRLIRYFGLLANRIRGKMLSLAKLFLQKRPDTQLTLFDLPPPGKPPSYRQRLLKSFGRDPLQCPYCKTPLRFVEFVPAFRVLLDDLYLKDCA